MPRLRRALDEALTPAPPAAARRLRWALVLILAYQIGLSLWLGWPEPGPSRWWDERFNVLNIESCLRAGRFSPANGYYGGVSYVPQTLALALAAKLHAVTGWQAVDVLTPEGTLSAAGYHLIRGSQALCAAIVVLLTYALARRLASPEVAVAAAALLAVSPRLIHAGAIFKPDVELLAATLLALLAGWLAAARPASTVRYLLAGGAIGLAVGAKLNGVAVAVPLALATAIRWREFGRWPRLALAGAASFGVYWLFNPHLAQTLRSLSKNQAHYGRTSTGSWLDVLAETVSYPFRPSFHGPWIGALAVVGFLALGIRLAARRGEAFPRIGGWMVLAFPPIYYAVYVAASPRAKANHFLQIVPFGALFAAIVLVAAGRWLLAVDRRRWRLAAVGVLAALAIGVPAVTTFAQNYELTVPTTWKLATDWVERSLPDPVHGYRILTLGQSLRGESPRSPAYEPLPAAAGAAGRSLADADGIIASAAALRDGSELIRWIGPQASRLEPGLFCARGEPVVASLRPHRAAPHPAAGRLVFRADPAGDLTARLPAGIEPGSLLSVRLRLRLRGAAAADLRLGAGGESFEWIAGPASGGDTFFLSRRFHAPAEGDLRVSLRGGPLQAQAKGELFVWGPR